MTAVSWWWVPAFLPEQQWQTNPGGWHANSWQQDARPLQEPQQGGGVTPQRLLLDKRTKTDAQLEARRNGFVKSMKNVLSVMF